MTSLGYCNVMNYWWFIYSYFLFIWLYGILSSYFSPQSPDIITSHIPLSDITSCSVSSLIFRSSFHTSIFYPAQLGTLTSWTGSAPYSSYGQQQFNADRDGWKLPKHLNPLKCPETSDDHIRGRIMWLSQEELPPLVAVHHVCSHMPAHRFKGFAGFGKMSFQFWIIS